MSTQISKRELFSKHALSAGLGVGALALSAQRASADTPFTSFPFTATGAPTPRTMPDRLAEIKNVKDYGAVGDGVTDDTAAIQACFDAAFGPYDNPHGGSWEGSSQNRPVYFPPGIYKVASAFRARSITGIADDGTGKIRLTVDTTGLTDGDMVYVRKVGGTTFANGSHSILNVGVPAGTITLSNSSFNSAWTGGGTICMPALRIRSLHGGNIFGAGRDACIIASSTPGAALISTNGLEFTSIRDITFSAQPGGIAFDLNCDGTGSVNLQSNEFTNIHFCGTPSSNIEYGVAIGMNGSMGSENTFINCYFSGGTIAAFSLHNYNALANTIIGGNIASANIGILVSSGACPIIHGVSFQNRENADQIDMYVVNGGPDAYSISGCRSESPNFLKVGADNLFSIDGCTHSNESFPGFFYSGSGYTVLNNCKSVNGWIEGNPYLIMNNCNFTRSDYLTAGSFNYRYLQISPLRITEQTGASYTIASSDGGTKIQFNRATAQTVMLLKNSDNSNNLGPGTKIEVQQTGVGQTTFQGAKGVTIRSSNGLKLRTQWSCAALTCDGADTWTLSGDTAV